MTNIEKILKQGYFYNIHNDKCHIIHLTNEYIVYKYFSYKKWRYRAESTGEFEAFTESGLAHSAERKAKK